MPVIRLETFIDAPKQTVFDLARSIDLHQVSTAHTNEKAVAGKTSGLIELNEWVTWEARHFGIVQKLTSKITAMNAPDYFVDEMVSGAFKSFRHEHVFEARGDGTLMIDVFTYISPLGVFGKLADQLFLEKYMSTLLVQRNKVVKEYAEKRELNKAEK
ncbi:SRPBCC family protein [Pedobacter frigoris]|uniref:Cell division protein n=1 Tax=Pedobacter frigoris TaxID=2571272 RepID=A0A4V5P216_9SPHI|nr:SRPBCC family protein [Pedobacter frigoris]TKC09692.1 cell division protein [Pedobacter frigoris]